MFPNDTYRWANKIIEFNGKNPQAWPFNMNNCKNNKDHFYHVKCIYESIEQLIVE